MEVGRVGPQDLIPKPKQESPAKGAEASKALERNDSVTISGEGRKLHDLQQVVNRAKDRLQDLPEVREERLEEVRGRVARAAYRDPDAARKIAERILDSWLK